MLFFPSSAIECVIRFSFATKAKEKMKKKDQKQTYKQSIKLKEEEEEKWGKGASSVTGFLFLVIWCL